MSTPAAPPPEQPVDQLCRWRDDGTLDRIDRARLDRTPVKIRRSSGAIQDALVATCCGHGGLVCVVVWAPALTDAEFTWVGADRVKWDPPTLGRGVRTADLVELNPWLAAGSS